MFRLRGNGHPVPQGQSLCRTIPFWAEMSGNQQACLILSARNSRLFLSTGFWMNDP